MNERDVRRADLIEDVRDTAEAGVDRAGDTEVGGVDVELDLRERSGLEDVIPERAHGAGDPSRTDGERQGAGPDSRRGG